VNLAARIAGYAQPGQVLVSQALVEISTGPELSFTGVGAVELKGVAGATELFAAHRPR
jgi:class 3 adenylate cyclase